MKEMHGPRFGMSRWGVVRTILQFSSQWKSRGMSWERYVARIGGEQKYVDFIIWET